VCPTSSASKCPSAVASSAPTSTRIGRPLGAIRTPACSTPGSGPGSSTSAWSVSTTTSRPAWSAAWLPASNGAPLSCDGAWWTCMTPTSAASASDFTALAARVLARRDRRRLLGLGDLPLALQEARETRVEQRLVRIAFDRLADGRDRIVQSAHAAVDLGESLVGQAEARVGGEHL